MLVVILDKNRREIDRKKGNIEKGVFIYTEGGFWIFGKTKKSLQIDYAETISNEKGEKTAYYISDGSDIRQLTFKELYHPDERADRRLSLTEFIYQNELSELTEESMLKKPFGLKEITEILFIIVLGVIALVFYFGMSNLITQLHTAIAPINATTQQNTQLIHLLINQSEQQRLFIAKALNLNASSVP